MVDTIARFFLGFTGFIYLLLGIWCAVAPEKTAKGVGFELQPGQGQSEFFTVYGGLEVGLGIFFLWPIFRPDDLMMPLLACFTVHLCLVLFIYTNFSSTTIILASIEWVIFVATAVFYFWKR